MFTLINISTSFDSMPQAGAYAGYAPDYDGRNQNDLVMFNVNDS